VILAHERRHVVHVGITDHPTAPWTAEQLREAFPWNTTPRYLVRDRDSAFHAWATTTQAMDVHQMVTAARSPWQNAYVERLIGSIRERLDHVIVWNARGLRRVLTAYVAYYSSSRTHLSLNKDAPIPRHVASPTDGATSRFHKSAVCTIGTIAAPRNTNDAQIQPGLALVRTASDAILPRRSARLNSVYPPSSAVTTVRDERR